MELAGNSNAVTSAAFPCKLRAQHTEPLTVHCDLGQFASPSGRRYPCLSHHAQPEPAPGEPRIKYLTGVCIFA